MENKVLSQGWSKHNYSEAIHYIVHRLTEYIAAEKQEGYSLHKIRKILTKKHEMDEELYNKAVDEYIESYGKRRK